VDPGKHVIRAKAPGHLPHEESVTLAEGESKTLEIPPLKPEPVPEAPAASSSEPPPPPPPPSKRKTLGYVAGGVGVASLAVGAFFGLRTLSKKSESDKECPSPTTCSARGAQANEDAYAAATFANIGVGLGIVGLGVGTYLLLTAKPAPTTGTALQLAPALGHNSGGLWMQGRFLPSSNAPLLPEVRCPRWEDTGPPGHRRHQGRTASFSPLAPEISRGSAHGVWVHVP
jgi:hypothetical protein